VIIALTVFLLSFSLLVRRGEEVARVFLLIIIYLRIFKPNPTHMYEITQAHERHTLLTRRSVQEW
jgi:hypothetical protein